MTNSSHVCILLRMEGEAIKESVFRRHHIGSRGWRMAMVNDLTNSMRHSAMFDVFTTLFTFLVHL